MERLLDRRGFVAGLIVCAVGGPRLLFGTGTGAKMYGLIGSARAHPGSRDALVEILLEGTQALPGCLSYVVAVDSADEDVIWVTEVWESPQAHEASLALPAVQEAIREARPLLAGFGQRTVTTPVGGVGMGDVAASTGPPRHLVDPVQDRIVDVDARVRLPARAAFRHFVEPPLLERWLAPRAHVDARVGGPYELFWEPADPENNSTIGCRITALSPGQLIAFQWRSPAQFKPFANGADPLTHVVVTFHEESDGTRIHLLHSGWRSDARWEEARAWQERAWHVAFVSLERITAERS